MLCKNAGPGLRTPSARSRAAVSSSASWRSLPARHGLQATSFADVLERAHAPRGSVYHHFPGGKDQLVDAALGLAGARMQDLLDGWTDATAEEVTDRFLGVWRGVLSRSKLAAGCAVLAVAIAADSPDLLAHTAAIFRQWRRRLAQLLEEGGLAADQAQRFAATLVAAAEGAVVLSRAEQSMEPFDLTVEHLLDTVRRMMAAGPPLEGRPA